MKSAQQIKEKLDSILENELLKRPSENIVINAPVALMQLELESKANILKWVLCDEE